MMDLPFPAHEDVLAQPTRVRLFALLGELKRAVGTAELADRLGLHPNGVRIHLGRLRDAGLIDRIRVHQGPGRPRDAWTIAADARPGGTRPHAYADLGRWLAQAIPARPGRLRDVEAAGRDIGRKLAPRDGGPDGAEAVRGTLTALGFAPHAQPGAGERMTYTLRNCPYRDAVRANQVVVCTLHRGITRGLLDVLEPRATLTGFEPRNPDDAGCLIRVSGISSGDHEQ